ncbi:hypothetical protein BGX31_008612 [Mortierella sp. GBA43]|nr:hypothetical protein BGX31_008612 [Mortierella sp. GBA43]
MTQQQHASPPLQSQQSFFPCKNDFIDPKDITSSRLYEAMFGQPGFEGCVSPVSDQSCFDVADDESTFTTPSGSPIDPFPNAFVELGFPNMTPSFTMPIDPSRMNPIGQGVMLTTAPVAPSPLKQVCGSISDDSDLAEDFDPNASTKRKKRVRKPSKSSANKPKAPRMSLRCQHPNCTVICSSYPSLTRHSEAHKWRGQYSPVRCEACQGSLSNEYSVQRHILRSPEPSRCRKMRIYSIMKSEIDIESTVRFYPNRPHGKKTVKVDLEKMKFKYFNN